MAIDLQFIEKLCQKNTDWQPVPDPIGWEEVSRQESKIVKESLKDPRLAKIYAKLVCGDITFDEFVVQKRALDDIKLQEKKEAQNK
jgi:hypothetical protein